jgi:hypothetical protein
VGHGVSGVEQLVAGGVLVAIGSHLIRSGQSDLAREAAERRMEDEAALLRRRAELEADWQRARDLGLDTTAVLAEHRTQLGTQGRPALP